MRVHILETPAPSSDPLDREELPVDESPGGWAWQMQQPLVISDIATETRFPAVNALMRQQGVRSYCVIPLTTAQRRLGGLGFGSLQEATYDGTDLEFLQLVAKQVAVAVDNALNYQSVQGYQQALAHERDRLRLLLEVNNAVVSHLELKPLFAAIAVSLRKVIEHDYTSLALHDAGSNRLWLNVLDFPEGKGLIYEGIPVPIEDSPGGVAFTERRPVLINAEGLQRFESEFVTKLKAEGVQSICCLPLITPGRILGTLNLASLRDSHFTPDDMDLLAQVASQIAIALENALAFREIDDLKNQLTKEKLYLEDEIRTEYQFEVRIGPSRHPVSRRSGRHSARNAIQTPEGITGTGIRALGGYASPPRECPNGSGNQPESCPDGRRPTVPERPLLSPECFSHHHSTFARTFRRHSLAGPLLRAATRTAYGQADRDDSGRDHGCPLPLSLAGQHPGVRKPDRAFHHSVPRVRPAGSAWGIESAGLDRFRGGDDPGGH